MTLERKGSTVANVNANAYALALRFLTMRSYSVAKLRQRLQSKGCDEAEIEQALDRCKELGYLNDERYAQDVATTLMQSGNAVGSRLLYELKKKGIDPQLAAQVSERCRDEYDEAELLMQIVQRRYAQVDFGDLEQRQKRRIVNYLHRRGFALATILHYLKQLKDSHVKC